MARLPLEGIRVADFSWIVVGPYCTQWLAMMGAEVIKIESSLHIDITRRLPPFAGGISGPERGAIWNGVNMSKKSCTLNLTRPEGVELAIEIIKKSDIVIEQFSYGMMERFGLGYNRLRELKPELILVSSSGLGRTGPDRKFVGYNENFVAYSGLASVTGYEQGPPVLTGGIWADHETGTNLTFAVLAALYHRLQTGQGQFIDISMVESVMTQIPEAFMDYAMNGRIRQRMGNRDDVKVPHSCYPCSGDDQWIAIEVYDESEWIGLCQAMDHPEWIKDNRFSNHYNRKHNEQQLDMLIAQWTIKSNKHKATKTLQRFGVPAGPVLNLEEITNDPHLDERGYFVAPIHPEIGSYVRPGTPFRLSAVSPVVEAAPMLGQHNEYVFCELLGMSVEKFAELVGDGIIF